MMMRIKTTPLLLPLLLVVLSFSLGWTNAAEKKHNRRLGGPADSWEGHEGLWNQVHENSGSFEDDVGTYPISSNNNNKMLKRSVLLSRHCPRVPSPFPQKVHALPGMPTDAASYAEQPWPTAEEWGAGEGMCTDVGKDYARNVGGFLAGLLPQPIAFTVDGTSGRDNTTADMIMEGLNNAGVDVASVDYQNIFSMGTCTDEFNSTERYLGTAANLATYPKPYYYGRLIALLQLALGENAPESVQDMDDILEEDGSWVGQGAVAASLAEEFLLERQSGMEAAWGKLTDDQLASLVELNSYALNVGVGAPYMNAKMGTALFQSMLEKIEDSETTGSHVFVGHDINIASLNGLLGLHYKDDLFGVGATTPVARLQFDVWEDGASGEETVTARFFSVNLDGGETNEQGAPVIFLKAGGETEISLDALRGIFEANYDEACLV